MPRPSSPQDAMRGFLSGEDPGQARFRRVMRHIPHGPNCKLCAAPFEGPGGAVLRNLGFARYPGNPAICGSCIKGLNRIGVYGAEIEVSLLFADIRGSTGIGESMSPTDFRAFLDSFYRLSSKAILDNDGIVDKFVGDEVIGLFFIGISGREHSTAAIRAARELLDVVGRANSSASGPIPVGAAVHTGIAFVGTTGTGGDVNDFTAVGDIVNTTARLAGEAVAGELLVSVDAATAGGLDSRALERRTLSVRGRSDAVEVVVLRSPTAVD
ncbi:MAG TPA: adenylate/guanylate cyclase domain-containing protein [Candidatus Limnocylindrales bacterium]|nr:adenylate/guanylate cyclase domain-containing protein [Candidatus Limnocylindrales bacterium]